MFVFYFALFPLWILVSRKSSHKTIIGNCLIFVIIQSGSKVLVRLKKFYLKTETRVADGASCKIFVKHSILKPTGYNVIPAGRPVSDTRPRDNSKPSPERDRIFTPGLHRISECHRETFGSAMGRLPRMPIEQSFRF